MSRHKNAPPTINELPRGDQMPKKSSSKKHQDADRAYEAELKRLDITSRLYHTVKNHKMPANCGPSSGQNNNTNSGTAPRARSSSRGRGNQSATSSRAPSSERGPKKEKDDIHKRYRTAMDTYKVAHMDMGGHFEALDFMAAAIQLSKTNGKYSVLNYLTQHGKAEQKYYDMIYVLKPNFENKPFEFKEQSPKTIYKYYMTQAIREMRDANVDYNADMSKAVMMALVINQYHSPPEMKKLSFPDFIKKHPTADDKSIAMQDSLFQNFSHMKKPAGIRPTGRAQATPHHAAGRPDVLTTPVDTSQSSFDTQHFGEVVPDEYRV